MDEQPRQSLPDSVYIKMVSVYGKCQLVLTIVCVNSGLGYPRLSKRLQQKSGVPAQPRVFGIRSHCQDTASRFLCFASPVPADFLRARLFVEASGMGVILRLPWRIQTRRQRSNFLHLTILQRVPFTTHHDASTSSLALNMLSALLYCRRARNRHAGEESGSCPHGCAATNKSVPAR